MEDYKKKYEDALERAREMCAMPTDKATMEYVFPELKESEDEKIRKALLNEFTHLLSKGCNKFAGLENEDIITWLERQDEQNFVDKVEQKFKVGDWVVCEVTNSVYQIKNCIENLSNHKYGYDLTNGGYIGSDEVNHYHLWTIQDAKDGDVLAGKIDGDDYILIFKQIKDGWVETYGHYYDAVDRFCVPSQLFCRDYKGTFHPATKKQCDLLFQKMHEAGYEWDAEKKELSHQEVTKKSDKVGWSEEDERLLGDVITACYKYYGGFIPWPEIKKWLKSIKGKLS